VRSAASALGQHVILELGILPAHPFGARLLAIDCALSFDAAR
jgi:hypothetical protein